MVDEVLGFLGDARTVVDMTLGAGGHARGLLDAGVSAVIGVDRDPDALDDRSGSGSRTYGDRFTCRADAVLRGRMLDDVGAPVDGVLFDLGVSSMQLDRAERGSRYRADGAARHADGSASGPTAADLVNELPERELADLIFRFGEERRSRRIAAAIVATPSAARRPTQLAASVVSAVGKRPGGPHPARRTFQALRIAVNRELEELAASLPHAVGFLGPGGRVVVISYHSLEDGIVKRAFRDDPRLQALTKKPLVPSAGGGRPQPARTQREAARRRTDRGGGVSVPAQTAAPGTGRPPSSARHVRRPAARPRTPSLPCSSCGRAAGSATAFWVLTAVVVATLLVVGVVSLSALLVQTSFRAEALEVASPSCYAEQEVLAHERSRPCPRPRAIAIVGAVPRPRSPGPDVDVLHVRARSRARAGMTRPPARRAWSSLLRGDAPRARRRRGAGSARCSCAMRGRSSALG